MLVHNLVTRAISSLLDFFFFEIFFQMDWKLAYKAVHRVLQKLYVTMFPCNECAKIIIQVGASAAN